MYSEKYVNLPCYIIILDRNPFTSRLKIRVQPSQGDRRSWLILLNVQVNDFKCIRRMLILSSLYIHKFCLHVRVRRKVGMRYSCVDTMVYCIFVYNTLTRRVKLVSNKRVLLKNNIT